MLEMNPELKSTSKEAFVLIIPVDELGLRFAHMDHLLQQGDISSQEEMARKLVENLYLRPSRSAGGGNDGPQKFGVNLPEGTALEREFLGIPMNLELDRGVPLALKQQETLTIPHMPIRGASGNVGGGLNLLVNNTKGEVRTHTRVKLSGRVEPGGGAIIFILTPVPEDAFPGLTPNGIRLAVSEVAALSAVSASQALRLAPALGRGFDCF